MRCKKRVIRPLLFLLLFLAAAVGAYYFGGHLAKQREVARLEAGVQFGHCSEDMEDFTLSDSLVSVDQLRSFQGDYANLSSHYYRDALSRTAEGQETVVYNAVLYALEHGYSFISVPAGLCSSDALVRIVYYAVFDQPMLEENTRLGLTDGNLICYGQSLERQYIYLPVNDKEHLDYKRTALREAERIVAGIPGDCETDMDQARYLYNWLVEHVQYTEDEEYNASRPHYLYDALIRGETNCDGFSNAYTLLMNLAGLECFNVGNDVTEENDVGHTWNVLKLDGTYYQADPTAEAGIYREVGENLYLYFCLSAGALNNGEYEELIRDVAPACDDRRHDMEPVDVLVEETSSARRLQALQAAIHRLEEGASCFVIRCDSFAELSGAAVLRTVEGWLADCRETVTLFSVGKQYCVVFRGDRLNNG